MPGSRSVAVVGAGWAGLAAAVRACAAGHQVTLFDMARHAGGRARGVSTRAGLLDNGQHILIGAYTRTLALMHDVGADQTSLLRRMPLSLTYPDGRGLRLPPGPPIGAFVRGVLAARGWSGTDRLRLLLAAGGWSLRGFRCDPGKTVAQLCGRLPGPVLRDLVEPLCVAALNTPMEQASAAVFLRVLRDALFSGPGSADLLLPRASLSELLPQPALVWLAAHGATLQLGRRVIQVTADAGGWRVDGTRFDGVVLACSAHEAARLALPSAPAWSDQAAALHYQPIVTAYLRDEGLRLPGAMLALDAGIDAPAQFVFDLGALDRQAGLFAFVASGAADWVAQGMTATGTAMLGQARRAFPGRFAGEDSATLAHIASEQRATFACTPGLARPPMHIATGLLAAGDYIDGPYPATLEGAVRIGEAAAAALDGATTRAR